MVAGFRSYDFQFATLAFNFLARLVTNRSTVYVIQLGAWSYSTNANAAQIGRIRAKYTVVADPPPPSKRSERMRGPMVVTTMSSAGPVVQR
jgi:hypothetical protein